MKLFRALLGATLLSVVAALGCSDDSTPVSPKMYSATLDSTFVVGTSEVLVVSNFAGKVRVAPGAANGVDVVAEKWASREQDLDSIGIEMLELQNGVRITTTNPSKVNGAWVDVGATIPVDMRPQIQVGAGDIAYRGPAPGETLFVTGAGNITLTLPAGVNVEVLLSVGAGTIRVEFPVVGQVSGHVVDGVIGTGTDGRIVAQVGAGSIVVESQ